jgi:hypothetical protein
MIRRRLRRESSPRSADRKREGGQDTPGAADSHRPADRRGTDLRGDPWSARDRRTVEAISGPSSAPARASTHRDIYRGDALAWVMFKLARLDEARVAFGRALALGDHDRAREELTIGTMSPRFDVLQAKNAQRQLAVLGNDT